MALIKKEWKMWKCEEENLRPTAVFPSSCTEGYMKAAAKQNPLQNNSVDK